MKRKYRMPISRLTVDKLGVKLYDKVSAVIAEVIANSYDADATEVVVHAPMGQYLASKSGGQVSDKGLEIKITDNGVGMTQDEMQDFYLIVGAERRTDDRRGPSSRRFERRVMGRKGVGKLAPFGICKTIEVISSGGEEIIDSELEQSHQGYLTSHIIMEYDRITQDEGEPGEVYEPTTGDLDGTLAEKPGTTVILNNFNYRRVPAIDDLSRQIAQRFGIQSADWKITVVDNSPDSTSDESIVGPFALDSMPNTEVAFMEDGRVIGPDGNPIGDTVAGFTHDEQYYPIRGWMAYSKIPYRDSLMAGVRIYCRGKIASQTSIFNMGAGFTGEYDIRSYLIGELHADWLDEQEDLIQTDRRDILWSDELGAEFERWGQAIVRRIGNISREPSRTATLDVFLETGNVEARIKERYPSDNHVEIRSQALNLAKMFGRTINRAEAQDVNTVNDLVSLSMLFAPHVTLDEMMRDAVRDAETPISAITSFLQTARIAELSSFGRIAEDRLKVVDRLEHLKDDKETEEGDLQILIESAPWLINPEWAPVTANQSLNRLRREFETYYERRTSQEIALSDFLQPLKRPDFVLSSQESKAQIVEIKTPGHILKNSEMDRIINYYNNMDAFLGDNTNADFRKFFHDFHITLVCDGLDLEGAQQAAFDFYVSQGKLTHISWPDFLLRTTLVHRDFLDESRRQLEHSVT